MMVSSEDINPMLEDSLEAKESVVHLAQIMIPEVSFEDVTALVSAKAEAMEEVQVEVDNPPQEMIKEAINNDENDPNHGNKANLIELPEEVFNTVPLSVRGRAKHGSAVTLLRRLSTAIDPKTKHFMPVTISSLEKHGCKVTGKTGESLIASLKALDMIHVSKQGISYKAVVSIRPPTIRGRRVSMKPLTNLK
jgi:hypothetical protein